MSEDQTPVAAPEPEATIEPSIEKKAYDFADLGLKLKLAGLELAEDAAQKVVVAVLDWASESAKLSANPYDDMALVVLPKLKEFILGQVAKIDAAK